MLWLGDFNRHHPLWELDQNQHLNSTEDNIQPLLDLIHIYNMELILPPGTPTYETVTSNWTRPDNVWLSSHALNLTISCNTNPYICPIHADHLPIITVIDMPVAHAPLEPHLTFVTLTSPNSKNPSRPASKPTPQPFTSPLNNNSTPKSTN